MFFVKKTIPLLLTAVLLLLPGCTPQNCDDDSQLHGDTENSEGQTIWRKPIIYLYPEETIDVTVKLAFDGKLICTYPAYENSWHVTASPDSTLVNHADGKTYSYLFWEGESDIEYDMSDGFVVKGEDTAEFLQEKLSVLGLTPKEYNEFIVYWLPLMQDNPYNLITFQTDDYTEHARLDISPEPDSVLRVFMAYKPLETPVEVKEPTLKPLERRGFAVVEWGGTEVK